MPIQWVIRMSTTLAMVSKTSRQSPKSRKAYFLALAGGNNAPSICYIRQRAWERATEEKEGIDEAIREFERKGRFEDNTENY